MQKTSLKLFLTLSILFSLESFALEKKLLPYKEDLNQLIYYSADFINANLIEESAELKGNVRIVFNNYEVTAKEATVFKKKNTAYLKGNVQIESQDMFIQAEEANLNYKTQKGDIRNVRVTSGQLLLEAESLDKLDDTTFLAHNAQFTTCITCPPAWKIKGKKIKTNIQKYIEIKGGVFQLLNQSVLPIPHIKFPINTRRKTGLIPFSIGRSTGTTGTEIQQPYFWAIDPHSDLTLSPMIYLGSELDDNIIDFNGAKLHLEYRQWLSSKSWMNVKTALMKDLTYVNINSDRLSTSRWFFNFKNYFELPNDFVQKSEVTLLREREYLNDFINETNGQAEPSLRNSFSISKFKKNKFISAEVVHNTNLLVEDPFETDNFSIQKLPDIRYSISKTPIWKDRLLAQTDLQYTNFFRNGRSFDDIVDDTDNSLAPKLALNTGGDGRFDPSTDLLRSGHRLRLNASLSAPFKIKQLFKVTPEVSYRDAYYKFNIAESKLENNQDFSNFAFSRYLQFTNSFEAEFSAIYNDKYKHKFIPKLITKLGTNINRSDNVFFDSQGSLPYHRQFQPVTDTDFFDFRHGIQFDYHDRFFRAEVAELHLTNLIIQKKEQDDVTYYDQPFYFKLKQSYDFRNARLSDTPDPWSNLDGTFKLKTKYYTNLTQASYFYRAGQTNISTRNRFKIRPGKFFSVGYTDFFTVDEEGRLTDNRTQDLYFSLSWEFPVFKFSGRVGYSLLNREHLGWETHFLFTPRGNCWGLKLDLFEINNSADRGLGYSVNVFFNFGPDNTLKKSLLNI